jgi:hypothetical protein
MPSRFSVFIAGGFPTHTYVHRKFEDPVSKRLRDPETEITEAFNRPGMLVQVSGPSKSGKTVALHRMIPETQFIKVPGSSLYGEDSLWRIVSARLEARVDRKATIQTTHERGSETGGEAELEIGLISFGGKLGSSTKSSQERSFEHSVEDDFFKVATDELLRTGKYLFIDDFHTVPSAMKRHVAAQLKAAAERNVKIVLAEVPHMADEPIAHLPDLSGRIERIEFNYWSADDLVEIAKKGFDALNVSINESALMALADEAGGSPQLMQRLCLDLCKELEIDEAKVKTERHQVRLDQLNAVFGTTIRSVDYSASIYLLESQPIPEPLSTTVFRTKGDYRLTINELAVSTLCLSPPRISIPFSAGMDTLETRAARVVADDVTGPDREMLSATFALMNEVAQHKSFKIPTLDFKPHRGVTILDPYFLYSLRWSGRYYDLRTIVDQVN